MKGLSSFNRFDCPAFFDGKRIIVTRCEELLDFETKKHLGTKLTCVITQDRTKYPTATPDKPISNRFEQFTIKLFKDIDVPVDSYIMPVGATGTVYGEYRNKLSITAEDIQIVQQPKVQ